MKISSCLLGLIGLGWLIYCLFQPIFDQFFGWDTLPREVFTQKFEGVEETGFEKEIEASKRLIDSIQAASSAPSISVAAMINGKMVWTYAVGFQNIARQIAADTSTQYRIGSTSKALTSLGLGKMIEVGEIHPDSSIQYYTHAFMDKPNISIRQLASHQSGLRNYDVCLCFPIWEYYRNKQFGSIAESVADFESDELLFAPGDEFAYSSFNFSALSLAMDNVSINGYLDYMTEHVFKTLGMNQTLPDQQNVELKDRSIPYEVYENMYREAAEVNLSNKWAGGGFLSTPSDLVRAGNVLLNSTFLGPETIDLLTSPQRLNNDSINVQNYAMGWRHNYSKRYFDGEQAIEIIHHGGMAMGGQALLVVYPAYDLTLALTLNKGEAEGNFQLFDYITPIGEVFISKLNSHDSIL
ncbi:MAG: serine hydrolase domain-containing protein [Ekhidna sp.]